MDEDGQILPIFDKVMDINVIEAAVAQLGENIDQRLLSTVYDYEGNLWFTTGGFRIDPDRDPAGFLGYISRDYMQQLDTGEEVPLKGNIFFYPLDQVESAENGIAANQDGAVILTNLACYLLNADDGVNVRWRTSYESGGANDLQEGSGYTGGGPSWGSGTSPTLTNDLVLFTDNLDPINLLALSSETGNAGLSDPDADSAIQSYDNIYDPNWMAEGNAYIAPGVERVDFVQTESGYEAKKAWSRTDIHETAMIKLSTATGYLYGYWQDLDSGMWRYEVLDFNTGETLLTADVSTLSGYNNLAVGLIADPNGNGLYSPTNIMEMVSWRDVFAYLPNSPVKKIPAQDMGRYRLTDGALPDGFQAAGYLMTVTIENLREPDTLALRMHRLSQEPSDYTLFYQDQTGELKEMSETWALCAQGGEPLDENQIFEETQIYEIRFSIADGSTLDQSGQEYQGVYGVVLAQKQS